MTENCPALGLILLFPALGVVFHVFCGRSAGRAAVNFVGPAVVSASFGVALWAFAKLFTMPPGAALAVTLWPWIEAGRFHVDVALRFDALAAVMTLVVSGVGALIHVYSVGYMARDDDCARDWARSSSPGGEHRVQLSGHPNLTVSVHGTEPGEPGAAGGGNATAANRIVNAIPACAGP